MGLASAVSTCPACAVPEIAGSPVAALLVELLVTAGTPDMPVVKEATSLPATSWSVSVSSTGRVGSV